MPPHPRTLAAVPQHLSSTLLAAPRAQPPSASAKAGGSSHSSFIIVKINKHTKQWGEASISSSTAELMLALTQP